MNADTILTSAGVFVGTVLGAAGLRWGEKRRDQRINGLRVSLAPDAMTLLRGIKDELRTVHQGLNELRKELGPVVKQASIAECERRERDHEADLLAKGWRRPD